MTNLNIDINKLNNARKETFGVYVKIDLKNNLDDTIIKYCEYLTLEPSVILSLKHTFKYDFIWTSFGSMIAYEKDNVFYQVKKDATETQSDDFTDKFIEYGDDLISKAFSANYLLSELTYSELKILSEEVMSFSFTTENNIIDDTLNEEINIDRIFDKINEVGLNNLTYRERKILDDYSKSL